MLGKIIRAIWALLRRKRPAACGRPLSSASDSNPYRIPDGRDEMR